MLIDQIYLIGAGGHGKVVMDALLLNGVSLDQVYVTDGAKELEGLSFFGRSIGVPAISKEMAGKLFHLAIGGNHVRENLFLELEKIGACAATVIHPMASISRFSTIRDGAFVAAKAVVAPDSVVGVCAIINHGAVVDHDCEVGSFSHIAPNATLGGGVRLGSNVLIGAGANVLPGIVIGEGAVVGAGAVVIANIEPGEIQVGIPAKKKT